MFQINDMTALGVNAEYLREFVADLRSAQPAEAEPIEANRAIYRGSGIRSVRGANPCEQAALPRVA